MTQNKISSAVAVQHIVPVIEDGDCMFEMDGITENSDGEIVLALNAARRIRIEKKCEKPIGGTQAQIMAWLEVQMKEMMERAKIKLGVGNGQR